MAWKRGTQNQQAGVIRKGHIRQFLVPSSRATSQSHRLKVLDLSSIADSTGLAYCSHAVINPESIPKSFTALLHPESGLLYIHAHDHPVCVIACRLSSIVPIGCIVLTHAQRLNSKVCVGENELWSVYQGDEYAYDVRSGSIGNTEVRRSIPPVLHSLILEIRPRNSKNSSDDVAGVFVNIDCRLLRKAATEFFAGCIVSLEEIHSFEAQCYSHGERGAIGDQYHEPMVFTVSAVIPVSNSMLVEDEGGVEGENESASVDESNCYRGFFTDDTLIFFRLQRPTEKIHLLNNPNPAAVVSAMNLTNKRYLTVVNICTSDGEVFPVSKNLLRPCLSLTFLVQAGRGKYSDSDPSNGTAATADGAATADIIAVHASAGSIEIDRNISDCKEREGADALVPVDACTFDRVLLYLEHAARDEPFIFDPLLAGELREAGIVLGVQGLVDVCDKALGSFSERVRRTYIRYDEVIQRNENGRLRRANTDAENSIVIVSKGDMLLILDGMVLDISRWIDEHPGGANIIPEQALNLDCSAFFEIYHASKQSFLYLKEFYLGEILPEDLLHHVPRPPGNPSPAYLQRLAEVTSWRLKPSDMIRDEDKVHKSF